MVIKIDHSVAGNVLRDAVSSARDDDELPVEWVSFARAVFGFNSKSYVPVLATLLLAKAVDEQADAFSIKETGERSYSLRTLGERVVVPAAPELGLSLRLTGPQPFNNSPWSKHDRIDLIDRPRNKRQHGEFVQIVARAEELSTLGARSALAAFARVSIEEAAKIRSIAMKPGEFTAESVRRAIEDYLRQDAVERPRRLQAFAAACLDLGHSDVRSRKINDPSRDTPGDVQAYVEGSPILSVEVRGKPVSPFDVDTFVEACANAGIGRIWLFVDHSKHQPIDLNALESHSLRLEVVQLSIFESAAQLVRHALAWSNLPLNEATSFIVRRYLERLREIEVPKESLEQWVRTAAVLQATMRQASG